MLGWSSPSCTSIRRCLLNAQLAVLTRDPEAFLTRLRTSATTALSFVPGDVRTFAFPTGDFPYIIHAATEASARQLAEAPDEMQSTIVAGTGRIHRVYPHIKHPQAPLHQLRRRLRHSDYAAPIRRSAPPSHDHLRPIQARAEQLIANARCEVKIARCYAFLGPHLPLDTHFAAGNFLADALASRPIHIASDGRALRSYLYPTDLVIWLWTLLFRASPLHAYNVGSDRPISIAGLAETICSEVNPSIPIHIAEPGRQLTSASLRFLPQPARKWNSA